MDSRNLLYLKFPFDVSAINHFVDFINEKIKRLNSKPYKLIILDWIILSGVEYWMKIIIKNFCMEIVVKENYSKISIKDKRT